MTLRVLRYNADGSLDQSFGDHARSRPNIGDGKASSLAVQNNKIKSLGLRTDGDKQ